MIRACKESFPLHTLFVFPESVPFGDYGIQSVRGRRADPRRETDALTMNERLGPLPGVKTGRIVQRDDGGKGPAIEIVLCSSHVVPEMFRDAFAIGTDIAGGTDPVSV